MMRRGTAVALASALACALAAALWSGAAHAHVIEGRVIHPARPNETADVEVFLFGLQPKGDPVQRSGRTDAEGRFRFSDVAEGNYFVGARYAGLTFPGGRASFDVDDPPRTESVVFHVYDRTADPEGVELSAVRWIVEREAGVYRVSNIVTARNGTDRAVHIEPESPTPLRVPLARGHGPIETPLGQPPPGLTEAHQMVELRGPFFPGEREYLFAYDIPTDGASLESEFTFAGDDATALAYVELMVRDFGVLTEVGRLHPARPARQGDEVYLRWIGFSLGDGTSVPLRLEPLPPRGQTSRAARAALAALLAAASLFFVLQPVRAAATRRGQAPGAEPEGPVESPAHAERRAVIASLVDLEHDFETGKVSREDHDELRSDLRRQAVQLMERERAQTGAKPEEAVVAEGLGPCDCGRVPQPGDRYCASCGKEL